MVGGVRALATRVRRPLTLRSVLAPSRWSLGAAAGALGVLAVTLAEAASGSGAVLVAGLSAVAVLTGLAARRGDALLVGVLCLLAAVAGGLWTDWSAAEQALAVAVVAAVATAAFLTAQLRAAATVTARRLDLLRDLLRLGEA